jgi:ribonuclease P protein component
MVAGALRGLGSFRAVINGGLRWDAGLLRSYVRVERGVPAAFYVGISVSAREYTAVERNRLRRLVREGVRRERPAVWAALQAIPAKAEMVVQVRRGVDPRRVRLQDLHPAMTQLCKRLVRQVVSETP